MSWRFWHAIIDSKLEVVYAFGYQIVRKAVEYLCFAPWQLEITKDHMVFLQATQSRSCFYGQDW